jgi:hypothetical protein
MSPPSCRCDPRLHLGANHRLHLTASDSPDAHGQRHSLRLRSHAIGLRPVMDDWGYTTYPALRLACRSVRVALVPLPRAGRTQTASTAQDVLHTAHSRVDVSEAEPYIPGQRHTKGPQTTPQDRSDSTGRLSRYDPIAYTLRGQTP